MSEDTSDDTIVKVAALALFLIAIICVLSIYITIRISQLSPVSVRAHKNEAHLCWMTSMVFGEPTSDTRQSCEELREEVYEVWRTSE